MADISDVEQALVDIVAAVLYPNGASQPSALPGAAVAKIYRGWPTTTNLDPDLKAGISNVTVWPRGGIEHNTTRYPVDYQEISRGVATLTAVVRTNTLTIGGTNDQTTRQFITVQLGPKIVVSYQPLQTDGLNDIAAVLAAQITAQGIIATSFGPVVTIQSGVGIRAIIGVDGKQIAEIARQETMVQVTSWCPSPDVRDAIGKLIGPVLAETTFLTMPDQSACRLRYHATILSDGAEKPGLYRRDALYTVEYATTLSDTATEVTVVQVDIDNNNDAGGVAPPVPSNYPFPAST